MNGLQLLDWPKRRFRYTVRQQVHVGPWQAVGAPLVIIGCVVGLTILAMSSSSGVAWVTEGAEELSMNHHHLSKKTAKTQPRWG
jgi:uncharacterized iron-regulated membrane protein